MAWNRHFYTTKVIILLYCIIAITIIDSDLVIALYALQEIYINNIASACLLLLDKHPVLVFVLASLMYAVVPIFS